MLLGSATPKLVLDTRSALMGDLQNAGWRERLRGWYAGYVARVANNWADGQTAATRRMAKVVEISPARMWGVWPAGVDLVKFQTASGARLWPRDVEALRLIYTGFLDHDRNLVALCQAVEQVNAEGMHFHLTMIGKGSAWNRLDQLALASRGSIELYEEISHEKIPGRLAQAHVGVIPYPDVDRFQVASPLKLFEYMASGLPVLATAPGQPHGCAGDGAGRFLGRGRACRAPGGGAA